MARLPRVTASQAIRALERAGFSLSRQSGSHKIYKNDEGKRVTVPYHTGTTQGRASYTMEFSAYDFVPGQIAEKVIAAAKAARTGEVEEEE